MKNFHSLLSVSYSWISLIPSILAKGKIVLLNNFFHINSHSSKKVLAFFLCFFLQFPLFSQARLVLKDDAYLVLNTVETTGGLFVVLDNDDANALSTGGNIITKHEKNQIKWNIGTNTGNYTVPFTAPNNAKTKIPFTLEITDAGTGSGNIKFSSYTDNDGTDNYKVSDYKPSDVTDINNGGDANNSANVVNRFWIVDANGYDTDENPAATLSFNYADDELTSGNNYIAEANIFPQRWNSTASQWHDVTLSGTPDVSNNKLTGVIVAKENFFRSWALVSNVTPLPVELIYFDVKRTGSFVLLEWETLAEINNDYFIVEKSSDGENWEEISTVDGQGNTNEQTYYSQIDVNGCVGICYYRLIQVDFDGRREKEGIRFLNSDNQNQEFKMTVIPNPMNQRSNISFSALEGGVFNLSVLNQTGHEVYTTKTIGDKGNNQISFDSSTLSHGSYYFILEDESGNRSQQLVIK